MKHLLDFLYTNLMLGNSKTNSIWLQSEEVALNCKFFSSKS
ncbi:hypothetical protein [Rivularia sp. PCC 7116]|nr:hypothetical protein [Rivularia sp. PCC 7116]